MNKNNSYKTVCFTLSIISLLLLLPKLGCIQASETEPFARKETYEEYFKQQENIYKELLELKIPGARRLNIDTMLAEEMVTTCPKEIKDTISGIKQDALEGKEKSIIIHGLSGTGKSGLAQAIAIQAQTPCLFFSAGDISTEYMNSGVQNLQKIFHYAEMLEKRLGKPCVIIFDELEALTKKHVGKNHHENNILISFWQKLDQYRNNKIVVVGTMNSLEDLPVQVSGRTSMVKIPLPTPEQRAAILSFHLKQKQKKHQLTYCRWVNGASLARPTKGFSNRELVDLVERATQSARLALNIPGINNKTVSFYDFTSGIKEIKKDPIRKLEREIGTWKHTFKTHLRDPKVAIPVVAVTASMLFAYNSIANQKAAMKQAQKNFDYQTSTGHILKQAAINSICSIPVAIIGAASKCCC